VKALEHRASELTPSQALQQLPQGRCREQTAGTYGRNGYGEGVLQTTNPGRTGPGAAKAEAARKSAALKSVSVRLRPRAPPITAELQPLQQQHEIL
jgi:hypothetical protein